MLENLKKLEKLINSELSSKVQNSIIENNELFIKINEKDLLEVVQFLKSNEKCKFRQLIDIAGVDYPGKKNASNLSIFYYLTKKILELNFLLILKQIKLSIH